MIVSFLSFLLLALLALPVVDDVLFWYCRYCYCGVVVCVVEMMSTLRNSHYLSSGRQ